MVSLGECSLVSEGMWGADDWTGRGADDDLSQLSRPLLFQLRDFRLARWVHL